jgi:superfamily I DNA and RNA helicase
MSISTELRQQLISVARDCRIKVIGYDLVKNDSEAELLIAIIKAYGDSPAGFIYAAPSRARTTLRPPDVVLCHPDVGLLVLEAKGFSVDQIEGVEAGSIKVRYQGYIKPENVIRQVEDQMFEIDADITKLIRDRRAKPLTNCMAVFPRISEGDWARRGYDKAHPSSQLLFKEQIEDQTRLKKRIANLVREGLAHSHKEQPLTVEHVEVIAQVFGNSDVINERRPPRSWVEREKLGSYVDEMATLEKYLSEEQKELSRMEWEGTQRLIRGVAGSGKSVVLANLVARYLHRRLESLDSTHDPALDVTVAVTCFNHALVDFLKQKIRTAFRAQTLNENIPANVMLISHLNGLMWMLTEQGWPIRYIKVGEVQDPIQRARLYREQIAEFARDNPTHYEAVSLDAVFLDEGQDFEPEEYKLLLDIIKPHPVTGEKPIVVFYDDAQNLYGRTRPVWNDIGINVAVGNRSRVMRECFRNTRQIVELAFNVLLGSQAPADTRVQTRTYADVAYLKERGLVEEVGDFFRVKFAEREYQSPVVRSFPNESAEVDWVASELARLIRDENVRPEDILVVFYRQFNCNALESKVKQSLPQLRFLHPFGNSSDKDQYIFQTGCLTISTTHGAKGYDAPIVFVVGADRFDATREGRAGFYVAATRAKLLLYVTGVNKAEWTLLKEAQSVRQVL